MSTVQHFRHEDDTALAENRRSLLRELPQTFLINNHEVVWSKVNNYRQFFTSGVAFTFLVVGVTGVIFQFFFKTHLLEEIHGWLGVAMVAAAAVHIYQNWRPLKRHLQDKRVYALLIPVFLLIAFFTFGDKEKEQGVSPRAVVRKLSQAHAGDVARSLGKDVATVNAAMKADGLQVQGSDETVQELARNNNKPPEAILNYFMK
jgi:hypothetical protein